jgi:hypothetical protein
MTATIRRTVTINRSAPELEEAWRAHMQRQQWREQLSSTQLEPQPSGRGTLLRVFVREDAGGVISKVGQAVATLRGENLTGEVEQTLRQFKALIEAGEIPTTAGQPAGNRSLVERVKESLTPRLDKAKNSAGHPSKARRKQPGQQNKDQAA